MKRRTAHHAMGALKRRYVTKTGAVKEYRYATVKGLPYKEYRRDEWKRLFRSKSRRSAPLTEAEAERVRQLHQDGVGQAEIAKYFGTTRYHVQVGLGVR
jgi:DNA invertase Pin-like site-specific DNA recombinase